MSTFVEDLLSKMTLAEKIGQLRQVGPSLVGAFDVSFDEIVNMVYDGKISKVEFDNILKRAQNNFNKEEIEKGIIGSINGVGDIETANKLQRIAVEKSRLGIPLLFGYDVVHGFRTITPIPLAESCAWNPQLWNETARMSASEASSSGVHITFAPMIDVSKDARWGRVSEGAGEDTLLTSIYGVQKTKGFQGKSISDATSLIACPKHFVAYGAAEAGKDYNSVEMSYQKLFDEYLPPFKAVIDAGAKMIMPAFNTINSSPCTSDSYLLTEILRNQWGFDGVTISDANAISELTNHGVACDNSQAAKLALEAGMDIDMISGSYFENLEKLVKAGQLDERYIDRSVKRILQLKFDMGLFENPYRSNEKIEKNTLLTIENRELAKKIALESIVLLKNESRTLPINMNDKIAVVGELATNKGEMTGAWAIKAVADDCLSLVDGLHQMDIDFDYFDENQVLNNDINWNAYKTIIYAFGEIKSQSGEAASRSNIEVDTQQKIVIEQLAKSSSRLVGVLFNGRPLALASIVGSFDALIEAWHLGVEAGSAITDIIFGFENPSGKLTMSFPKNTGQLPLYYNHLNTGRPAGKGKFTSKYLDADEGPLFPFGFGLSYTDFDYSNLRIQDEGSQIRVSIQVENVGERSGYEVVQCYLSDPVASLSRPIKKLAAFKKVWIDKGEKPTISFQIEKEKLGFYNRNMDFVIEEGEFVFQAGKSSKVYLESSINLTS